MGYLLLLNHVALHFFTEILYIMGQLQYQYAYFGDYLDEFPFDFFDYGRSSILWLSGTLL